MDVSPVITTNFIGQKTEKLSSALCERSCEELSTLFQELKGLRIIVGNLMDGLQKVVGVPLQTHSVLISTCVCYTELV